MQRQRPMLLLRRLWTQWIDWQRRRKAFNRNLITNDRVQRLSIGVHFTDEHQHVALEDDVTNDVSKINYVI